MSTVTTSTPFEKIRSWFARRAVGALWASALVGGAVIAGEPPAVTTVIIVRHAEKDLGVPEDPPLSAVGRERSNALERVLRDRAVSAVYTSDTRRARETAQPLAHRRGLEPIEYPGRAIETLVETLLRDQRGKTVVVVGHSNTVPELVHRLTDGRESVTLRDDEFDALFIVARPVTGVPILTRESYTITSTISD